METDIDPIKMFFYRSDMADKDDNNMKETLESIRRAISERLGSPVVGTFILFWLLLNWPILVLLWKSQLPIEDTISAIYATRLTLLKSLVYPATITVAYLLIYPWISFAVSIYHDWVKKKRIKSKKEIIEAEAELELIPLRHKHSLEIQAKGWESDWLFKQKEKEAESEAQAVQKNTVAIVANAISKEKRKINAEMEVKEYRLEKEEELRKKYPANFDRTKGIDWGK